MFHFNHSTTGFIGFAALACAVLTTACPASRVDVTPPPVVIDAAYDLTVDFSKYERFDVVGFEDIDDGEPPPGYTATNRRAVENEIIDELSARGLELDDLDPDLRISPFVRLTDAQIVDESWWWDTYWGWYWGYATPWYDRDVREFEAGTLVIDAVAIGDPDDEDDDELVFRGTATGLFWGSPLDRPGRVAEVVDDIFDYWPSEEAI